MFQYYSTEPQIFLNVEINTSVVLRVTENRSLLNEFLWPLENNLKPGVEIWTGNATT